MEYLISDIEFGNIVPLRSEIGNVGKMFTLVNGAAIYIEYEVFTGAIQLIRINGEEFGREMSRYWVKTLNEYFANNQRPIGR